MSSTDESYLALLNNPIINPPPNQSTEVVERRDTKAAEATFKTATSAQQTLKQASQHLVLASETDAEFEAVNIAWNKKELPTAQDLVDLGLVPFNTPCKTKSLDAFFSTVIATDSYGQSEQLQALQSQCKSLLGDNCQVYLMGEITIHVFILGLLLHEDHTALVGLQSLLVHS
ncbi:nuclease A inhibitor-like protein-domain-containing protein [Spinellus fusiger]|nr:nuclease A inhibitor-like protein-domain-containing protein [Spinellus fusiger]